jgi:CAAX protease family protein
VKRENIFMKIWRVVYPVGIYFLISNIISFVFIIIAAIFMNMDMMTGKTNIDMVAFQEQLTTTLYKNSMMLTAIAAAITIPIAGLIFRSDSRKEYMEYEKLNVLLYGLVIIAAFTACLGSNQLLTLSRLDEIFPSFQKVQEALYGGSIIMEVLAAVILAPIIEELLFRGLVFKRLYGYMGRISAMIISSLFFGIYHGNMVQGIYAFIVGMLFVFVYDKYKTIAAPILAHMVANLTSVLSVETGIFDFLYTNDMMFYISTVISVVLCIGVILVINKKVVRPEAMKIDRIVNINNMYSDM